MKQLINNLFWDAERDFKSMRKSDMKLSERIKYEKAMLRLELMKQLMDKNDFTLRP